MNLDCWIIGNCDGNLDGYSLDDVSSNFPLSSIVEASSSRIGVTGEFLDIGEWDALGEKVGNRGDAERMG